MSNALSYSDKRRSYPYNDGLQDQDWYRVVDPSVTSITDIEYNDDTFVIYTTTQIDETWLACVAADSDIEIRRKAMRDHVEFKLVDKLKRRQPMDILPIDVWFKGCRDARAADQALISFSRVLREVTTRRNRQGDVVYIHPRQKPHWTGLNLLQTHMHHDYKVEPISDEYIGIVKSVAQARVELFDVKGKQDAFYYYDATQFYQKQYRFLHIPVGIPHHIIGGDIEFTSQHMGWYLVEARVPDDWNHVGLMPVGSKYPRTPGQVLKGWVPKQEMYVLMHGEWRDKTFRGDRYDGYIGQDWNVKIKERITFQHTIDGTIWEGKSILQNYASALNEIDVELKKTFHYNGLLYDALKRFSNGGFALCGAGNNQTALIDMDEYNSDDIPDDASIEFVDAYGNVSFDIKPTHARVTRKNAPQGIYVPHMLAAQYAHMRDIMTRRLLELPYHQIIGVDNDAIFTTVEHSFYNPKGYEHGVHRLKGALHQPYQAPRMMEALQKLSGLSREAMHYGA